MLVERAKALLSHAAPAADLAELHLRAMRALVTELEHEKYAVRSARPDRDSRPSPAPRPVREPEPESEPERTSEHPRQRGRHVPAAIRRAVFERDAGRCSYRNDSGERCRETTRLELHHKKAFARDPLQNIPKTDSRRVAPLPEVLKSIGCGSMATREIAQKSASLRA